MWGFVVFVVLLVVLFKWLRRTGPDQPVRGCVFVTGCDSGMGETTAFHLAKTGFHVFAACFTKEGVTKYEGNPKITAVQLDVSSEEQVNAAAEALGRQIEERKLGGLFGVLQCAGIAFTAPFEYIPMASFKRQMDVNFYGYVYVAKAFLPLLKRYATPDRRGRICFVSSGPLPGPGVPFITSYLAAKWAGEAVIQGLQFEFALRELPIDCVVLSPGVVKPTRLAAEGLALLEKTFKEMPPVRIGDCALQLIDFSLGCDPRVQGHGGRVSAVSARRARHARVAGRRADGEHYAPRKSERKFDFSVLLICFSPSLICDTLSGMTAWRRLSWAFSPRESSLR